MAFTTNTPSLQTPGPRTRALKPLSHSSCGRTQAGKIVTPHAEEVKDGPICIFPKQYLFSDQLLTIRQIFNLLSAIPNSIKNWNLKVAKYLNYSIFCGKIGCDLKKGHRGVLYMSLTMITHCFALSKNWCVCSQRLS